MPWKTEISQQTLTESEAKGLAKNIICSGKQKVVELELSKHANDVQAILINPPWDCSQPITHEVAKSSTKKCKSSRQKISIEEFCANFKIPTSVMKDGLVFIWVEKEIISDLIKFFEGQDFVYVENVCYVMLD